MRNHLKLQEGTQNWEFGMLTNQRGKHRGFCWTKTHRRVSSLLLPSNTQEAQLDYYAEALTGH